MTLMSRRSARLLSACLVGSTWTAQLGRRCFSSAPAAGRILRIDAAERKRLESELGCSGPPLLRTLLEKRQIAEAAQAHISNFHVAAAAFGASGSIYFGVNLEFPGHPISATIHAEQFAIVNAALNRESSISDVVVNAPPCGHCRQFMQEVNGCEDLSYHVIQDGGEDLRTVSHTSLLPDDFGPRHLDNHERILSERKPWSLALPRQTVVVQDLAKAALDAANQAYAPYSKCPSGVALRLQDGQIFSGYYMENCAFNPSVPPMQAAVINAIASGAMTSYEDVKEMALVEMMSTKVSWARVTYLLNRRMHLLHARMAR
eukprot:TRINITY_DN83202_c0_g1_i1.p1 TRINITY_DN83202_c0_g1~~TRINITY_DN83202_c0_g1_i1.p1  ORF type:complete len:332 (+),score=42.71 TRINITY_DN83202_c0_g1_i1:46-996(+)